MPDHQLDEGAQPFWSLLAEAPSAVTDRTAEGLAADSKVADLTGSQPSKSVATAEMPSTTAKMPSTTVEMPSASPGMPSTLAGMLSMIAETPSTTSASDTVHQVSVSPELSIGYTREHTHQQEQQQQQEGVHYNVSRMGHIKSACLPSARSDGSSSSATSSAVPNCELTLAQTDTVDLYGHNNATAEGGTSTAQSGGPSAQSTASTAQRALPTSASSAVADQGLGCSAVADQEQIIAPAAQTRDADRQLDLSSAHGMSSSAWLEDDLRHSEVKSEEEEEAAADQAAPLAASTVEVNPQAATAEALPAIAEVLPVTAISLPATAEALPAIAGGWISTANQAAVAAQADVPAEQ